MQPKLSGNSAPENPYASSGDAAAGESDPGHRPRRWLAIVLSMITPGLGHAYTGLIVRGLGVVVLSLAAVAASALTISRTRSGASVFAFALVLLGRAVTVLDLAAIPVIRYRAAIGRVVVIRTVLGGAGFVALTVMGSLALRHGIIESFKIPSAGMSPTLLVGDNIFVDKMARSPRRGDVIVFDLPSDVTKAFVQRVVGLEGDRIEVDTSGTLSINGRAVRRCRVGVATAVSADAAPEYFVETLGARRYLVAIEPPAENATVFGPYTVPAGQVFTLGDNRNNSYDSRLWSQGHGVPLANISGRATTVWWTTEGSGVGGRSARGDALVQPVLPAAQRALELALARCMSDPSRE